MILENRRAAEIGNICVHKVPIVNRILEGALSKLHLSSGRVTGLSKVSCLCSPEEGGERCYGDKSEESVEGENPMSVSFRELSKAHLLLEMADWILDASSSQAILWRK